jgi:hypothetical protein
MNANIEHIRHMLSLHHRDKSTIMETAITTRLNKSLFTYDKELNSGVEYVQGKSTLNVLKKL